MVYNYEKFQPAAALNYMLVRSVRIFFIQYAVAHLTQSKYVDVRVSEIKITASEFIISKNFIDDIKQTLISFNI